MDKEQTWTKMDGNGLKWTGQPICEILANFFGAASILVHFLSILVH